MYYIHFFYSCNLAFSKYLNTCIYKYTCILEYMNKHMHFDSMIFNNYIGLYVPHSTQQKRYLNEEQLWRRNSHKGLTMYESLFFF